MIKRISLLIGILMLAAFASIVSAQDDTFSGVVYEDLNRDGVRDADEPGIAGVLVSNGRDVVPTDANGTYSLPVLEDMIVFITKPAGYMTPVNEYNIPQFHYVHRPNGSPEEVQQFESFEPTGDLPESLDFALYQAEESDNFKIIVFGDTQTKTDEEIDWLRDGAIAEVTLDDESVFGISLGDNVYDDLSKYPRYLDLMAEAGFPWYYAFGNHDLNFDGPSDKYIAETHLKMVGPTYYSFDYGQVHFVVLDTVFGVAPENENENFSYHGSIDEMQWTWLVNDLSYVPEDKLIVLNTHIPLVNWELQHQIPLYGLEEDWGDPNMVDNRQALYDLIADRPALALGGHIHTLERFLPGDEYYGWDGATPFPQIIAGAISASWWFGTPDPIGQPTLYMRSGAPSGYLIMEFDGNTFTEVYKPVGRELDDNMNVFFMTELDDDEAWVKAELLPNNLLQDQLSDVVIGANIFSGSSASVVEIVIDDRDPMTMDKNETLSDPYAASFVPEDAPYYFGQDNSIHLWTASLPDDLEPGSHSLTVRTTDVYGQQWEKTLVFEVWMELPVVETEEG